MPTVTAAAADADRRRVVALLEAELAMDNCDAQEALRLAREVLALNRQVSNDELQWQAGVSVQDIHALVLAGKAEYALGAHEAALSSWMEARASVLGAEADTPTARAILVQIEGLLGARQEAERLVAELEAIGFRGPRYFQSPLPATVE